MKIRSGFVSNSSSSSFIISDKYFSSVRSLATYMLNKKIYEYENNYGDYEEDLYDKKLLDRLTDVDENTPISFSSCNYDTYIKKVADCYLVSTCNNTSWDLYEYTTKLSDEAKEELKEIQKQCKDNEDIDTISYIIDGDNDFSCFDNDFYNLDNQIVGVETYDYCPNAKKEIHNKDYAPHMWNTRRWGIICLKCSPYVKRKEKIDFINKCKTDNE